MGQAQADLGREHPYLDLVYAHSNFVPLYKWLGITHYWMYPNQEIDHFIVPFDSGLVPVMGHIQISIGKLPK